MTAHAYANLTASDGTTAKSRLGDTFRAAGGAEYTYCLASGNIAAYAVAHVSAAMVAIEATTTLVGTAARPTFHVIPQFAVLDGEYFWGASGPFQLREDGSTKFKVLAANAATSVRLYTTATPGVLDDAVTTGLISGLSLTETVTTQEAADCVAVQRLVSFCEL